ncbi:MAG TPA: hypothetical protein DCO80_00870 [Ornithinibacillus sp.]|nr:hypothetical protein [Ornithinibacillus sp.]
MNNQIGGMKVKSIVSLLDFDGAYKRQSFYHEGSYNWIDFNVMQNVSLFCEKSTLLNIADKLNDYQESSVYYLGSGNYHYISYLLQSKICQPYTLILFDHHTDTLPAPSPDLISCGSWLLESLKTLPLLKKVYILGVSEEAYQHIPNAFDEKVVIYTEQSLHTNLAAIMKAIKKNIPTKTIYISIDKDVLDMEDALTGWDQGTLRLNQLMKLVTELIACKEIAGVDICGEYPVNPTKDFLLETTNAVYKNNQANSYILKQIYERMSEIASNPLSKDSMKV